MNRRIAKLAGSFQNLSVTSIDTDIFCFGIVGVHSTDTGQAQMSIILDFSDHSTKSIGMCFQHQRVFRVIAAQIDQYAAFTGQGCLIPEVSKSLLYPLCSLCGKSARAIDCEQLHGLFSRITCVFIIHLHIVPFLSCL